MGLEALQAWRLQARWPFAYDTFFFGSGPDRGQSPVELGDFPYVRLYIRPSVPPPLGNPARSEALPARRPAQPARPLAQPARPLAQPARPLA